MNVHFRRTAAAMLAGMMLTSAAPLTVSAENTQKKIVVLGDEMSSEKGMTNSYVSLVGRYMNADVTNLTQDGCTTEDLLVTLEDAQVQTALSQADVILFSVGMNDMMDPFMEELNAYIATFGFASLSDLFTADRSQLTVSDDALVRESNVLAKKLETNEISARDNVLAIGEKLSAYSDAQIICPNVYNCLNTIEGLQDQSTKRQTAYKSIMNPCGWVSDTIDGAYATLAEQYGFTVIDTAAQFKGLAYQYTGLMEMSYYPNDEGHLWIAQQITGDTLGAQLLPALGDVTQDGLVNAADATQVLIASAAVGAGFDDGLTASQRTTGDVDANGSVNAADASIILMYAAAIGSGDNVTLRNFIY